MANFYEKTIVLSKLNSGELPCVYLKQRAGEIEFLLQLDEEFDYLLATNGTEVERQSQKKFTLSFEFDGIFACGVYHDEKLISYGSCGGEKLTKQKFLSLASKCTYDDWQIATENYYKGSVYDKADDDAKTYLSKEESPKVTDGGDRPNQNDEGGFATEEQKAYDRPSKTIEYPESTCSPAPSYYDKVRCSIENILNSGKPNKQLSSLIPLSKFAEIKNGDKSYFLGLQGKQPNYVIYAVKGKYGFPPTGFDNAFFINDNLFKPTDNGFYLLIISTKTGQTINIAELRIKS